MSDKLCVSLPKGCRAATQRGKLKAFIDPAGHETTVEYEIVGQKPDPDNPGENIDVYRISRILRKSSAIPT